MTSVLARLSAICLALPEAAEHEGVGHPSFVVRNRIFAMHMVDHHGDGRIALWCKAPPGLQGELVEARPHSFFVPPYVGRHGWVGLCLSETVDWDEVAALVEQSFRLIAPKTLVARI